MDSYIQASRDAAKKYLGGKYGVLDLCLSTFLSYLGHSGLSKVFADKISNDKLAEISHYHRIQYIKKGRIGPMTINNAGIICEHMVYNFRTYGKENFRYGAIIGSPYYHALESGNPPKNQGPVDNTDDQLEQSNALLNSETSYPSHRFKYVGPASLHADMSDVLIRARFLVGITDEISYIVMPSQIDDTWVLNVYSIKYRNWVILDPSSGLGSPDEGIGKSIVRMDEMMHAEHPRDNDHLQLSIKNVTQSLKIPRLAGNYVESEVYVFAFLIMFSMGVRHINDHDYMWMFSDYVLSKYTSSKDVLKKITGCALAMERSFK